MTFPINEALLWQNLKFPVLLEGATREKPASLDRRHNPHNPRAGADRNERLFAKAPD